LIRSGVPRRDFTGRLADDASPQVFAVIRLTWTGGGKTYVYGQETKELAMNATRSGRGEYTARQDFVIRVTITVVMLYGFLLTVSFLNLS
jgi:hypothetical protein